MRRARGVADRARPRAVCKRYRCGGQISCLWIVRDRGRLAFRYRVGEAEFECWTPVHKTARVLAFPEGQAVRVLLDPANPRHAIVRDLYVAAPAALVSGARR